jgi:hypothetical protein
MIDAAPALRTRTANQDHSGGALDIGSSHILAGWSAASVSGVFLFNLWMRFSNPLFSYNGRQTVGEPLLP